jgi:hypothetical protein
MKHIKTYRVFESEKDLTPEQEEFLNECTQGKWSYSPSTGEVNVDGSFKCSSRGLDDLKGIRFGRVSGDFNCSINRMKSLEGAPQEVGGDFSCSVNSLKSLKGAPQKVGGGFYCSNNLLESLEGAPQEVEGDFNCYNNLLESLKGAPQEVGGSFYCDAFSLAAGQWNPTGWMKIFKDGKSEAQKLILIFLSPDVLNQEIQKDPQGMIQALKTVWDFKGFAEVQKKLKFPDGYGDVDKTIRSLQKLDSIKDFI